MIRVHRIAYSTNVERVSLAAGVKGIEIDWVDNDPRRPPRTMSHSITCSSAA
jgi:hypothetical protein